MAQIATGRKATFSKHGFEVGIKLGLSMATCGIPSYHQIKGTLEKLNPRISWGKGRELPVGRNGRPENVTKVIFFPFNSRENKIIDQYESNGDLKRALLEQGGSKVFHVQLEEIARKILQERRQFRPNVVSAQVVVLSTAEVGGEIFFTDS